MQENRGITGAGQDGGAGNPSRMRGMTEFTPIVHVDGGRAWRGGQQQMLLLAAELRRRGCAQWIVARDPAIAERLRAAGCEAHSFRHPPPIPSGAVVHAHDGRALSWVLWRGAWRRGRATLVASRRVAFPPRRLTIWKYRRARRVLAVSGFIRRQLLAAGLEPERVETVPDGIDLETLPAAAPARARIRAALQLPESTPVAATLAAFTPEKNLPCLLEALARGPGDLHVLLAGEGPGLAELRRRARELRLESRLHVRADYPALAAMPLAAWVAAADFYVLPSRQEGLGSSLLVAMAYALPLMAARVGGIPELVEDGRNGVLLDPDDAPAWAAALTRLAAEPERARALGARGRRRVAEFTAARLAERTLAAYAAARAAAAPR